MNFEKLSKTYSILDKWLQILRKDKRKEEIDAQIRKEMEKPAIISLAKLPKSGTYEYDPQVMKTKIEKEEEMRKVI